MDKKQIDQKVKETARNAQARLNKAKNTLAKVDWKAKAILTSQIVFLLVVLSLHLYATIDNFRVGTSMGFICLLSFIAASVISGLLFKFSGPESAIVSAVVLFALPISTSGMLYGGMHSGKSFVLAGFGANFWLNLVCLVSVGLAIAWLLLKLTEKVLVGILSFPLLYIGISFLVGTLTGAPLEVTIMGPGFLSGLPLMAQGAFVYLNVVAPIICLLMLVMTLISLVKGEMKQVINYVSASLLFLLIVGTGLVTMHQNLIPNLMSLIRGRKIGQGYVKLKYVSDWEKGDKHYTHEVEVYTKGFDPGSKFRKGSEFAYTLSGSVHAARVSHQKTSVRLMVKDRVRRSDILNLVAKDLVVREDGAEQDFSLTSKMGQTSLKQTSKVVICLDGRLSYWWRWRKHAPRAALKAFIEQINASYDVLLLKFGHRTQEDITNGFVRDTAKLLHLIDNIDWCSSGHFFDGLMAAYDQLEDVDGNGIIVVFTGDRGLDGDKFNLDDVRDRVEGSGHQLIILGLNPNVDTAKIYRQLAKPTGGAYLHAPSESEFVKKASELFDNFSCTYEIAYKKKQAPVDMSKSRDKDRSSRHGSSGGGSYNSGSRSSSTTSSSRSSKSSSKRKKKARPPEVTILSPLPGATLTGPFPIRAKALGQNLKQVDFFLDDVPLTSMGRNKNRMYEHEEAAFEDFKMGPHTIIVKATDAKGMKGLGKVKVVLKQALPEVSIGSPLADAVIWKDINFTATVTGRQIASVDFFLDGKKIKAFSPDDGPRFQYPLPIKDISDGIHSFRVKASNKENRTIERRISFKTLTPKPSIKIISPKEGTTVFGTVSVIVEANSGWKEVALRKLQIKAGNQLLSKKLDVRQSINWATMNVSEGDVVLKAVLENEAGYSETTTVNVRVIKPKFFLSFTNVPPGHEFRDDAQANLKVVNTLPGTTVDSIAVSLDRGLSVTIDGPPWNFPLQVLQMKNGEHELTAVAIRSDGKEFTTTVKFIANPPKQVSLYLTIRNPAGKTLTTKEIKDLSFSILEDGKKVIRYNVKSAQKLPVDFGIIIDVSGSMKQEYRLERAKDAAVAFVDNLKGHDRAFLIKFSDYPELVTDLTGDRRKIQQEIEYLIPQKGTALYDAIYMGLDQIGKVPDRPAIILLTDGVDENVTQTGPGSKRTYREVIDFARRQEVQIYTIGLGRALKIRGSVGEKVLKSFASISGGQYYFAPSPAQLGQIFRKIISEVANQSKLTFVPPSGANDGAIHKISVSVIDKKNLSLIYKPTYLAK